MQQLLDQLGINQTFFTQSALFVVALIIFPRLFFRPFLNHILLREQKQFGDQGLAVSLSEEAKARSREASERLAAEKLKARAMSEAIITDARSKESEILNRSRDEAKQAVQRASENFQAQAVQIKRELEADIESLAILATDSLDRAPGAGA